MLLTLLGMAGSAPAYAQPSESEASAEDTSVEDADEGFGATAVVPDRPDGPEDSLGRSIVNRRQMDERLPQSAPDALRYEPGVSIQQTAHGQASPYVRGLTGQQVVHLFDGVRLNNGIYRQGPNQYFFTVDSQTLQRLEVIRGSASTRFGSDALGGAILAVPREPALSEDGALSLRPRAFGSFASADTTVGGRAELSAAFGENTAVLAGGGYRRVGRLEGGGVLRGTDGLPALVARLDDDRRTQLGTGFKEATFDFRLRQRIAEELTINVATYTYLELDSPRTDQCPPPEAPESECLVIDRQLRSLAYAALRGNAGKELRDVELIVSYQRHEEARTRDRSRSFVRLDFENEVDTLGITFRAATPRVSLGEGAHLTVRYGAEAYRDSVSSEGSTTFTDLDRTFENSRGEYLDDSTYLSVGAFAEAEFQPFEALIVRGGGRLAAVGARAPSDPESGSSAVHKEWGAAIGRLGVEVRPLAELSLHANADQGFRAPNLDDLTSRQQVGPGFQFENAELRPERTTTFELGVSADIAWLKFEVWGFATLLDDGMFRAVREAADCPPETPACTASRNQVQLVNADETSFILGTEGGVTVYLPAELTLRAVYSYAFGEGPNTGSRNVAGRRSFDDRVPLSRIPPLNGSVEGRWLHRNTGIYAGAAVRWALRQDRLAPADINDARIPVGGTPGYATLDLRAGWRWSENFRINLVFENVFDAAYRVHGSSINGRGRGVAIGMMAAL